MDASKQREIASKGGKAAHQKGTAHQFTPDEARAAGRKGGEAVSRDRQHMAEIGRQGGETVSRDRQHMSRIGREGGEARARDATTGESNASDDGMEKSHPVEQQRDERGERREERASRV